MIDYYNICENCGHDMEIWHYDRLGHLVCLKCVDCIRDHKTMQWITRKGDLDEWIDY